MRRVAVLALVGAAALGCRGGSPRLEGTWRGTRADGVGVDAQQAANAFAAQTTLTFRGDQVTITFPSGSQTGKYKVVRDDKGVVVIETDKDGPKDPQTFVIEGDKTLRWTVLDTKTITFVRQ